MGEMRRAIPREDAVRQKQDRFASTLVIAASIIAAVRRGDSAPSLALMAEQADLDLGLVQPAAVLRCGSSESDHLQYG
jgi:hypothetical protein